MPFMFSIEIFYDFFTLNGSFKANLFVPILLYSPGLDDDNDSNDANDKYEVDAKFRVRSYPPIADALYSSLACQGQAVHITTKRHPGQYSQEKTLLPSSESCAPKLMNGLELIHSISSGITKQSQKWVLVNNRWLIGLDFSLFNRKYIEKLQLLWVKVYSSVHFGTVMRQIVWNETISRYQNK